MQNQQIEKEKSNIKNLIYTIRDRQVMFDSDLARLYQVETRTLNQAVKRNIDRFPTGFRFQISENEWISGCTHLKLWLVTTFLIHVL